jgi:predicted metalloprotease
MPGFAPDGARRWLCRAAAVLLCTVSSWAPGAVVEPPGSAVDRADPQRVRNFAARVLGSTEDAWDGQFQALGRPAYPRPRLVLFRGVTRSACGLMRTGGAPVYCERDAEIYADGDALAALMSPVMPDFVAAYAIGRAVGEHVSATLQPHGQPDCYAGIWVRWLRERGVVSDAEIRQNLRDALAATRTRSSDSVGERDRWFAKGLSTGDPRSCAP